PKYDALSYCWGDTLQISTIEVDGRSVEVSKNLAEALFNAGLEVGDHIWADAICIDQSNLYEKSYQIMRMGQIYSQAEQTVV
ncbi:heterokaryon incompatibility, partial [Leptodontidium sp. 2 PMI_412]